MLKRTTCSPYCHLGLVASRSCIRSIYPIDRLFLPGLKQHFVGCSSRNVSTQHNQHESIPERKDDSTINGDTSDTQSSDAGEHTDARPLDSRSERFTLTPRFKWRWRWHFTDGMSKRKREKNGITAHNKDTAEANDSNHFLPTRTEKEQGRLDSLMGLLGKVSDSLRIPTSPLETAVENCEWIPKRQPTKEERQRLSFNPWAMMLAGRMRFDPASRIRAPEPLLMEMGIVTSPVDGSPYLMPDDLANFEEFDKRLQKGLRRLAMVNVHRDRGGGTLKILPYKVLIDELTNELVAYDQSTKRGRTKYAQVAKRLLSRRRWIERSQKINAYQDASKDYWKLKEKQGEIDDTTQMPERPFDENSLQWQPNIAERIHSIMKQRLILSIEHLGRKTDEAKNKPRKHFMCFEWPDVLYLNLVSEASKAPANELASEGHEQQYIPPQDDSESSDHAVPTRQVWNPVTSALHFEDVDIWLPGSFFLHIGPPATTMTALPHLRERPVNLATEDTSETTEIIPSPKISKFIPPMLSVSKTQRLPVFNLPALLGPKFEHPLHQILTLHGMVPPNRDNDSDLANANYLILIRGTAPGSHYISQELWRLWRYIGGTDCLRPEDSHQQSVDESTKSGRHRAKMEHIKKYPLFKQFWDNFYRFLPGIKRPVQTDVQDLKEEDGERGEEGEGKRERP